MACSGPRKNNANCCDSQADQTPCTDGNLACRVNCEMCPDGNMPNLACCVDGEQVLRCGIVV